MKTVCAGNFEKSDRSDCRIAMTVKKSGGIRISLNSKVAILYGAAIRETCEKILEFYGIDNAELQIDDSGAADYVIAARLEACIKQLIKTDKSWLPEILPQNMSGTERDRLRRSRLYLPGNSPKLAINAGLHSGDGIILDLEDSVAPDRKDEARILVRNTLRAVDFYGAERMVRINQGERGFEDLNALLPQYVNVILLPKCESAEQVRTVDAHIQKLRRECHIKIETWIMPIIESALGVMRALEIAGSSPNVVALAIGLEDYTADIAVPRTSEATESFFARSMVLNAAKACGLQAIDSVFSDVSDTEALYRNVRASRALGYDGMGCIHPRQIKVIHEAFAPDEAELEKAEKIVAAYREAEEKGLGVVAVGSKMIDAPVVKRALRVVELAKMMNKQGSRREKKA
ncbi:MAG: aldolase/citrate lyase family protein [Candidatus Neomarinimicrobiota bacterium]|nr:aldolase/citrate lyase family protein [Candidatus Neomarinimicrobiota bacterium]MDD3966641.1 aldolase/citrate lyase family protein [Candidatus Neomarinimicrobiota bacterium]